MDAKQKRRERKAKKRGKIRSAHLDRDRRNSDNEALGKFLAARQVIQPGVPDRNDREGWDRYNALNLKHVMKMALSLFRGDSVLRRFIEDPNSTTKHDIQTVEDMLTKAAQKICCSPPYFIPLVQMYKHSEGVNVRHPHFQLEKENTPMGLAWHFELFDGSWPLAYIGGKAKLFALSTHAIDRFMERVFRPCIFPPTQIALFMESLLAEKVIVVPTSPVLPITVGNGHKRMLVGYCPYDEQRHMAIARTFLLPTMRGTPEYERLVEKGMGDFFAPTLPELHDKYKMLMENGIFEGLAHYPKKPE